ncbi:MAG: OmpA family protein [Gemmatimonadetes bacterium]|nr:OmpA family protein [Gemmatimonadota bacterium]
MRHCTLVVPALIGLLMLGACGRGEPEQPTPSAAELEAQRQAEDEARLRAEEEARRRAEEEARRRAAEEARTRAAAAAEESARAREIVAEMVNFDFDRSEIRADGEEVLVRKVGILRARPELRLRIEGHADERGSVEYNLALGMRRAAAARDFLAGYGLEPARFELASRGEESPLIPEHNEDAWAQNRRAEFHIIAGEETLGGAAGTR